MADSKISALTDGGAIQAADEFVVERSGADYKIAGSAFDKTLSDVLALGADAGGTTITNLGAPSATADAATKAYVDAAAGGAVVTDVTTSPYTLAASSQVVLIDRMTSVIILPTAVGNAGLRFDVVAIQSADPWNGRHYLRPQSGETIDGTTGDYALPGTTWAGATIVSDGSEWKRIDRIDHGLGVGVAYVSARFGDDRNSGFSPFAPKQTIGSAITASDATNVAYRNFTICVMNGVYTETVELGGKSGYRLIGTTSVTDSPFMSGAVIKAPSDTASAVKASTSVLNLEIANIAFCGSGNDTYTGVVFDGTNMTVGCRIHDISITGTEGGFTGSKTSIGPGVYGGTGLLVDSAEQATYDNVSIGNCHIGRHLPGTGTTSKVHFRNCRFSQCFIVHSEEGAVTGGDNTFETEKTQNVFGLTYAIAHLASNGANPADGDTVTVRDRTYRFKSTMAQANDVQIGASIDDSLLNLVKAVNQTGVTGTNYYTGTSAPTGVNAGYTNLVDYGASGGNGFFQDQVDTTHHACTFQAQDVVGPAGNAYTFTVSSANLSDYFGKGTFDRSAWGIYLQMGNIWNGLDAMENISLPIGNCMKIACAASRFHGLKTAPQTKVSITGNYNYFEYPTFPNTCTIETGATGNRLFMPLNASSSAPSSATIADNGTLTVITTS